MTKIKKISTKILHYTRYVTLTIGIIFILLMLIATTSLPFWARYQLAVSKSNIPENTQSILVMGGGGFPSESVLMRLWYTLELANHFPNAKIIVATPGSISDSTSTIFKMIDFLKGNQIDSTRILYENIGINTRHQALLCKQLYEKQQFNKPLVIVTSPTHIYRTVKSFQKVGFEMVSGRPTFEAMLETDLRYKEKMLGGNKITTGTSKSITLRYNFWNYLKYEIEVIREYAAILYYKMKGWI